MDVYDDMNRFFCGHCGVEFAALRRGGTLSLERLSAAVENPPPAAGNDRVAALEQQVAEATRQAAERQKIGLCAGGGLLLLGFLMTRVGGFVLGLSMILAGILIIGFVRKLGQKAQADIRNLQNRLDLLQLKL